MSLAIFDLDNTLIAGDSDHLWGQFLVDLGLVERTAYEAANDQFFQDYQNGTLDIRRFLEFALEPLSRYPIEELEHLRSQFVRQAIEPILLPAARQLIAAHRAQGRLPLIITATNAFVTRPIASLYDIETLIATEPERQHHGYTGRFVGTPCFREGKVRRLEAWLLSSGSTLADSWFYSDSHNDLPLLELVTQAVAVDPDETLHRLSIERQWPILSLREATLDPVHLRAIEKS